MNAWPQRLVAAGLLLIFAGFIFALLFSWSAGHQARLSAHEDYQAVFEQIAANGETADDWQNLEEQTSRVSVAHRRAADVHGHSINMGILVILLGLLAPLFGQHENTGNRLLLAVTVAAVVYPTGLFLQFLRFQLAGEVVSAIGAAGAVATLAMLYWRFSRELDNLEV